MKAIEQYFHVVLFIILYKMVLTFKSVDETFIRYCLVSPGQTIATFERSISQHFWAQHVARVWPPRCDVCYTLGIENSTSAYARPAQRCCTNLDKRLKHRATSANVAWKIWPFTNLSQQHPTCCNTSQYVATGWPNARNMLRSKVLRYVALKCRDRLVKA